MACEFGKLRVGQGADKECETVFSTTKEGNLPIVINKMTYDAFTLFM